MTTPQTSTAIPCRYTNGHRSVASGGIAASTPCWAIRYPFTFSSTRAASHNVAISDNDAVIRIDRNRARLNATMTDDAITATGADNIAHVQLTKDDSVASVGMNCRLPNAPNVRVNSSSPAIAQPIATPASNEKTPPFPAALRSFDSTTSVTNRSSVPAAA